MSLVDLAEQLESPNTYEVTLIRGDIKVTGNAEAVAYFLIKLEKEKERKPFPQVVSDLPRFPEVITPYSDSRVSRNVISKTRESRKEWIKKLPSPQEVAKSYISGFGTHYDKSHAIEFIKGYINRRRIPHKYRGRVLMSIRARQDKRGNLKNLRQATKSLRKQTLKLLEKEKKSRKKYEKRDWSSLVIEYLGLEPKPTISRFLASKGLYANNQSYFRRYLTRAKSELTRKSKVHFQISELKSSGQKQ